MFSRRFDPRIPDIPTFRRTLGISQSENGSVLEQISVRGESSPVSFRSKRHAFCGDIGGSLAIICRFKKTEDCMVDQVESEPFSTSEFRQQTQFGSKLVQSPHNISAFCSSRTQERILRALKSAAKQSHSLIGKCRVSFGVGMSGDAPIEPARRASSGSPKFKCHIDPRYVENPSNMSRWEPVSGPLSSSGYADLRRMATISDKPTVRQQRVNK